MPPRQQIYSPTLDEKPKGPRDPSELVHINYPQVDLEGGLGSVGQAMKIAGHMQGVVGDATAGVARSLDKLGAQFERAGDEIFNRATGLMELQNETAAKKAAIEYDTYENQQTLEFQKKQGDAASEDAVKAHVADLQKKRDDMASKMGNPQQKRMFDNATMHSLVNAGKSAYSHAAKEQRQAASGATDGRIAQLSDKFSKTDDIEESQRLMDEVTKEFYGTKAPLQGWSKDEADAQFKKLTSHMYSSKITDLSDSQPQRAKEILEANRDKILIDDYNRVSKTVETNLRARDSRNIADRVQQEMKDAKLEDKIERGRKDAEKANPNDPKLPWETEQRIITQHNIARKEEAEEHQRNWNKALDSANGYGTPEGKKPRTREEYFAVTGAKEAFDSLSDTDKNKILLKLVDNAKEDWPLTPEARKRHNELLDEAHSTDPEIREKFMRRKDIDEEHIPGKMRDDLRAIQRKMQEKGHEASPTIARAMKIVGNSIDNTFKDPNSSTGKAFRGALQIAIEEETKLNGGKPLSNDQIREIVGNLLSNDPDTGAFGWSWTQSYRYEGMVEPTDADLAQMKNVAPWMSEMELRAEFTKLRWEKYSKEYEKLKSQGKVPQVPATGNKPRGAMVPTSQ